MNDSVPRSAPLASVLRYCEVTPEMLRKALPYGPSPLSYTCGLVARMSDLEAEAKLEWTERSLGRHIELDIIRGDSSLLRNAGDSGKGMTASFAHMLNATVAELVNSYLLLIPEGMIFYARDVAGDVRELDRTTEIGTFILNLVRYGHLLDNYGGMPPWAESLFIRSADVRAFNFLFDAADEDDESTQERRRVARIAATKAYRDSTAAGTLTLTSDAQPQLDKRSAHSHRTIIRALCKGMEIDPDSTSAVADVAKWIEASGQSLDSKTIRKLLRGN